jgi:hypothetical protein
MAGISSLAGFACHFSCLMLFGAALAMPQDAGAVELASHRAVYDIQLVSAKSGSQVIDVRGKMLYTIRKTCDGWISDHKFDLNYEYSGAPAVQVETKFTSFESLDSKQLNFSSSRMSDGEFDQDLRGMARIAANGKGKAIYSLPDTLNYDLPQATFFPAQHTIKLIEAAQRAQKILNATIFDGSDDQGPVEINAVIGKQVARMDQKDIDKALMDHPGWTMRLAVFPHQDEEQSVSDYEMTMELLDNGIVRNMVVDYHDFSVAQKLIALEPIQAEECGAQ